MSMNVTQTLDGLGIRHTTMSGAMSDVRQMVELAKDPEVKAAAIISLVLGMEDVKFENADHARVVTQAVVEHVIKHDCIVVYPDEVLAAALERARKHMTNPNLQWAFVHDAVTVDTRQTVELAGGAEANVAMNGDGSIKKGGKQVMAQALYKKHVLEAEIPMTNKEFVALLMKELSMSKSGATTYAYTTRKELGEPEGGIVKAKKARNDAGDETN